MKKLYSPIYKNWRKYIANNRGVAAVEFAIISPVFLMFVMGIIDFGRAYFIKSSMQYVVEQAARHAMVNPGILVSDLNAYADGQAAGITLVGATFNSAIDDSGAINFVTISGTYTFNFFTPLVGTTLTLNSKSVTPISED